MTQPSGARKRSNAVPIIAAIIAGVLLIIGIRWFTTREDTPEAATGGTTSNTAVQPPRDGCTTVNVAASSEKAALLGEIANAYRDSGRTVDGACFDIAVTSAASGTAEANLAAGWDESLNGPAPDVWTPAASTWVSLLQSDLQAADRPNIVPPSSESVTSTPLVLAMPEPMAKALGWPDTPIGWADVLALATDPQGWALKGHPEWGKFALGKTNPNVSTSGLAATIGTLVAATGTSSDLTQAALQRPEVQQYLKDVESSVIHYGDTTLTYLSNLQRADDAGAALGYLSAAAVEEKSVLDYNAGNPDRRPEDTGRSRAAQGAAGRRLPQGGHALQRQPVRDPGRALVERRQEGRCAGFPRLPVVAGTTEGVHRQLLPHGRRRAGGADHQQPLPDRRRRDDRAEPARPRRAARRPGVVDRGPQEGPGAGVDGRLRVDGR